MTSLYISIPNNINLLLSKLQTKLTIYDKDNADFIEDCTEEILNSEICNNYKRFFCGTVFIEKCIELS